MQKLTTGKRLKELRIEKGVSQRELAKVLNCAPPTVANYECDKRNLSVDNVKTVCEYFNVTSDFLLGLSDTKNTLSNTPKEPSMEFIMNDIQRLNKEIDQLFRTPEHIMKVSLRDKENKEARDCIAALDLCKTPIQHVLDLIAKVKEVTAQKK